MSSESAVSPSRRLDFAVIGAQKCATSWLFQCLQEHPGISLPSRKREIHYLGGPEVQRLGVDWFFSQYGADDPRRRGSVSVNYLHDSAALTGLLAGYPDLRMVVCVRNPLHRAYSAYGWLARKGLFPSTAVEQVVREADEAVQSGRFASGESLPAELITRGLYGKQLEPVFAAGAEARLLVVVYEHLCLYPAEVMRRVYEFLGVEPDFVPASMSARPKRSANLGWLVALERLAPRSMVMGKVMDHANQWACRLGLDRPSSGFPQSCERVLQPHFAADAAVLSRQLSRLPAANLCGDSGFIAAWGRA